MEEGVVGEVTHSISTSPKELFSMSVAVLALLTTPCPPRFCRPDRRRKPPKKGLSLGTDTPPSIGLRRIPSSRWLVFLVPLMLGQCC
jgi:hypothetical protein